MACTPTYASGEVKVHIKLVTAEQEAGDTVLELTLVICEGPVVSSNHQ